MNGTMTMTIENSRHDSPQNGQAGPACPFCGSPWSAAMLAALDEATVHHGCACCPETAPAAPPAAFPSPPRDIACDSCGRALFRAVAPGGAA